MEGERELKRWRLRRDLLRDSLGLPSAALRVGNATVTCCGRGGGGRVTSSTAAAKVPAARFEATFFLARYVF